MATSDQEQKSVQVPQHKRMAMGEKLKWPEHEGLYPNQTSRRSVTS